MGASFFIYCDLTKINRIPVGNPRNKTDESRTLPEILKCDPVTGSVCQCANCFLSVCILYDTHPHSNFVPFCTVLCCFFCARGFLISVRMAHRPPRATKQKALEGFHLMEEDSSNEDLSPSLRIENHKLSLRHQTVNSDVQRFSRSEDIYDLTFLNT
ncbi:unnamed protein product [Gadus morhua 'NCC']